MAGENYVKHIRSIQTALITISFLMMAYFSFADPDKYEKALNDLTFIKKVAEDWRASWLMDRIDEMVFEAMGGKAKWYFSYNAPIDDVKSIVNYEGKNLPSTINVVVESGRPWIADEGIFKEYNETVFAHGFTSISKETFIVEKAKNLDDFRYIWNSLAESKSLQIKYMKLPVNGSGYLTVSDRSDRELVNNRHLVAKNVQIKLDVASGNIHNTLDTQHYIDISSYEDIEHLFPKELRCEVEPKPTYCEENSLFIHFRFNGFPLIDPSLLMPVEEHELKIDVFEIFRDFYRLEIPKVSFEKAFPELWGFGQSTLKSKRDYESLDFSIRSSQSQAATAVEVLGAKIPGGFFLVAGAWVVVFIQIYFYLHLISLVENYSPAMHDEPWIALSLKTSHVVAVVLSVVCTPVVAVAFAFYQSVYLVFDATDLWMVIPLAISVVVATLIALQLKKLRQAIVELKASDKIDR